MKLVRYNDYYDHALIWDTHQWDRGQEVDFYVQQGKRFGSKVLYLMCATGGLARQLAQQGLWVTAVDREAAMIDLATVRHRDVPGLDFVQQDITDLQLIHRDFDLCICLDMALLLDDDARLAAFQAIAHHLRPAGGFIFPVMLSGAASYRTQKQRFHYDLNDWIPQDIRRVWKDSVTTYDAEMGITIHDQQIYIETDDGIRTFQHDVMLKDYSLDEIDHLLEQTGMKRMHLYADTKGALHTGGRYGIVKAVKTDLIPL